MAMVEEKENKASPMSSDLHEMARQGLDWHKYKEKYWPKSFYFEQKSKSISKMAKDRESHKSKKRPKDESSSVPIPVQTIQILLFPRKDKSKDKSGPPMENGEPTWKLGKNKKVKIREHKGKTYIDVRE